MTDLDPETLAKFRKLQLMLAESPEIMEALQSPELLALAAAASLSTDQKSPPPPPAEPGPEPNYPTIGCGHSDDVSVMSEMTTPTVMTKQPVFDEEFYPEVNGKGTSSSGIGGPRRPPIQQIGARPYEDGVLPPPPPVAGGKTKNKVSQVRPGAAHRAIARHNAKTKKAEPPPPMMKIREDDVSSKSSASSASDLRADLKKRPPPLIARNGFGKYKSPSADLESERSRYPQSTLLSSSSHSSSSKNRSKSRNRSGVNGRGVKTNRSMPTKLMTRTSNHSSTSKKSNGSSIYASSDDDDGDIDISTCADVENDDDKEEVDDRKSYPSPASSSRSKNSKSTTTSKTSSSSRSDEGAIQVGGKNGHGRSVPKMKLVPLKYNVNKGPPEDVSDSSKRTATTRKWSPPIKDKKVIPSASKTMNSISSHSQQQTSNKKVNPTPRRASYGTKNPIIKTLDNKTKTEAKVIEPLKKTEKPAKVEISSKPPKKTIPESSLPEENISNIIAFKASFASTQERQGTTSRPDDYLPGTDPFASTRKKKERVKKKYGDPSSSGMSRVDEWLGSGKTQKRTWKAKEATA